MGWLLLAREEPGNPAAPAMRKSIEKIIALRESGLMDPVTL